MTLNMPESDTPKPDSPQKCSRQKLIKRLKGIATVPIADFLPGACCYAVVPPNPAIKLLTGFLTRQTRRLTSSLFRGKFSEQLAPDEYQGVLIRLREAGLDVRYGTYDNHADEKCVMIIRFHGVTDVIMNPIPDVPALEAVVRFLDDDPAIDIEEIKKLFDNAK
jgi:hypothetical protein